MRLSFSVLASKTDPLKRLSNNFISFLPYKYEEFLTFFNEPTEKDYYPEKKHFVGLIFWLTVSL